MLEKEFLEKIEKAISDLPEKQKEVFLLSRIEKMKYREIAEILGISVKAVEKRMHLALLEMKEKIGNV
jgi:RNA polymerase sigma-70 factor (ECF subfamily)